MSSPLRTAVAVLGIFLPTFAVPGRGQGSSTPSMPWTEIAVKSAKLGEDRKLFVALPSDYRTSTRRYPVLVLLDANDEPQFASAVANVIFLASRRAIEPLIIVGVPNGKDRTHDMTPPAAGPNAKQFSTAGGADRFLEFLTAEVVPKIRAQYRASPYTILAGHSFGGLFAIHVAATKPGAFSAIVAMSPSIWWNDSAVVRPYAEAIARSSTPLRLFEGSGAFEPPIDGPTRHFDALLDSLRPTALEHRYRHYADNSHGLMPVPSLMDGLRFVFEPISLATTAIDLLGPTADSAAVVSALATTREHYAAGARALGKDETLPEPFVRQVGQTALSFLHLPGVATLIFRENLQHYPRSAHANADLGLALLAVGDTTAGRAQLERSVQVADASQTQLVAAVRDTLAKLGHAAQAGKPRP